MSDIPSSLVLPDYNGHSIINLMASLGRALGDNNGYPPLAQLPPETLEQHRNIVLLIIDGLGYQYLQRHPQSFLARHTRVRLTSVFPSTTASAITTFLTGQAPQRHGLTGWFTYLKELGSVAAVLPFRPRHGGPTYQDMGIDIQQVLNCSPFFDRITAEPYILSPSYIVDSPFSLASGGRAQRRGYRSLEEFVELIQHTVNHSAERKYIHAYWSDLDALSHRHGVTSSEVTAHFHTLDRAVAALHDSLRGSDTLLLVCADHGLIDTCAEETLLVEEHPQLAETLALPLCGEPRAAYCYVHPRKRHQFEDYVQNALAEYCILFDSEHLLNENYFGTGTSHPALRSRIGDYTLLMRGNYIIKDRLLGEKAFDLVGVHGGLSPEEMYVPLIVLDSNVL